MSTEVLVALSGLAGALSKQLFDFILYKIKVGGVDTASFKNYLRQEVQDMRREIGELRRDVKECYDDREELRIQLATLKRNALGQP
jgi:hypothetical protein